MNKPEINVTPLIDVLLVLLIIFMVISPLKPASIEARIPQTPDRNEGVREHPDSLVVIIKGDETMSINADRFYSNFNELNELTGDLNSIFKKRLENGAVRQETANGGIRINRLVFVKAPKSLSYGKIVKVIDAVKLSGASPLSLQIDNLQD
jgi:biopolymer transport protein ExbD